MLLHCSSPLSPPAHQQRLGDGGKPGSTVTFFLNQPHRSAAVAGNRMSWLSLGLDAPKPWSHASFCYFASMWLHGTAITPPAAAEHS